MVNALDKIIKVLFTVMKAVLTVLLFTMVVILVAHIFFRYVLNNSLTWSEEILKIMLVWFSMLSVGVLAVRREHVAIVVFKEHMPKKVENILDKITQLLTFLVCLVVIYVGFKYSMGGASKLTPALRLPYSYAYAAIPVSFIPVAFFELRNFLADITGQGAHAAIEKPEEDLTGGQEFTL